MWRQMKEACIPLEQRWRLGSSQMTRRRSSIIAKLIYRYRSSSACFPTTMHIVSWYNIQIIWFPSSDALQFSSRSQPPGSRSADLKVTTWSLGQFWTVSECSNCTGITVVQPGGCGTNTSNSMTALLGSSSCWLIQCWCWLQLLASGPALTRERNCRVEGPFTYDLRGNRDQNRTGTLENKHSVTTASW